MTTKNKIQEIHIRIESMGFTAISITAHKNGNLYRQGDGIIPPIETVIHEQTNGDLFNQMIELIEEPLLTQHGIYDYPNKQGQTTSYIIQFKLQNETVLAFEFHLGIDDTELDELFKTADKFISQAVKTTNAWYAEKLNSSNY